MAAAATGRFAGSFGKGAVAQKLVATRTRTAYDGRVMVPEPQGEG